jgi:hypothetical protein
LVVNVALAQDLQEEAECPVLGLVHAVEPLLLEGFGSPGEEARRQRDESQHRRRRDGLVEGPPEHV